MTYDTGVSGYHSGTSGSVWAVASYPAGVSMYALSETVEQLVGPLKGRGVNVMASCPLHEDRTPSLSVHLEEGIWQCFSCGAKGDLEKLALITGEELDPSVKWDQAIRSTKIVPPVRYNFKDKALQLYEAGLRGPGDKRISAFLAQRSIAVDARHHFNLGFQFISGPTIGAISFPYWEDDARKAGNCPAIRYRNNKGDKWAETGSQRVIYNIEEVRGAGRVLICEGETDTLLAWSLLRDGTKVCGIPGATVSQWQWENWALDFLFASDIMVALDADEAGDKGSETAIAALGDKARRVRPEEGLDLTKHYQEYKRLPEGII